MKDGIIQNKVKVFISSRESRSDDDGKTKHLRHYGLMRRAIKEMLESTNMAQVYVRECERMASTTSIEEDYLQALHEQDICVFIIDNDDDKEKPSDGVVAEYKKAKELGKPLMFFFCNEIEKAKTQIEKDNAVQSGSTCATVPTFDEIPSYVYKSVMNDIIRVYRRKCNPVPLSPTSNPKLSNNTSLMMKASNEPTTQLYPAEPTLTLIVNSLAQKIDFSNYPTLRSECKKIIGVRTSVDIDSTENNSEQNNFESLCAELLSFIIFKKDYDEAILEKYSSEIIEANKPEYQEVLKDRITALKFYFSGNVGQCYESLQTAYVKAKEIEHFPNWLLLDILIDLINIENYVAAENGDCVFDSKWQKLITENTEIVHYPILDRYVEDHFREIDKFLREHEIENPYTTRIGDDATPLVENCIKAFVIAVSNASLTQMLCVKGRLTAALSALCRVYAAHNQFFELIRLLSIDAKDKDISKHLISSGFTQIFSEISDSEARELLKSILRMTIKNNRTRAIIAAFHHFGYFFSDSDYKLLSNEIDTIIARFLAHEDSVVNLANLITKAIQNNIQRMDANKIVDYIIRFTEFDTPYVRDTTNLLSDKSFYGINEDNQNKLVNAYIARSKREGFSEPDITFQGLTSLRKLYPKNADRIDDAVINQNEEYYYSDYALNFDLLGRDGSPIDHIGRFIEEVRSNNATQGKNGRWIHLTSDPLKTLSRLIKYFPDTVIDDKIPEIVEVAKETLLANTQSCSAKIISVELLLRICNRRDDAFVDDIKDELFASEETILTAEEFFSDKDTRFLLHFNLKLLFSRMGKDTLADILSATSATAISDYTYIKMCEALFDFSDNNDWKNASKNELFVIFQFALRGCSYKNSDVRVLSSQILYELLRSDLKQIVAEQLSLIMDEADWELTLNIAYKVKTTSDIDEKLKKFILQKAKASNHYLVKKLFDAEDG